MGRGGRATVTGEPRSAVAGTIAATVATAATPASITVRRAGASRPGSRTCLTALLIPASFAVSR
jgi:hypothetical protein